MPDQQGHYNLTTLSGAQLRNCHAVGAFDPATVPAVSPAEQAAMKAGRIDDGEIGVLFSICASIGEAFVTTSAETNIEQVRLLTGALVLCPVHPEAAAWREAIKVGLRNAKLRDEGRLFEDGLYKVGDRVRPGTYAARDVHNCYWERLTSSGDVIDNDLILDAARVVVTIQKTEWRPTPE